MAVISKAGCNAGTCHGNANGKGGFKLSLRGQDPDLDYLALTRDLFARRTDPMAPEQSLILLKATTQLAHEGGLRFDTQSREYERLRDWIRAGTPNDLATAPRLKSLSVSPRDLIVHEPTNRVELQVEAEFADGARVDVRGLAVYEPVDPMVEVSAAGVVQRRSHGETTVLVRYLDQQVPVRLAFLPARPDFIWPDVVPENFIDEHVFAKLRALQIDPAQLTTDHEFIRRVSLDLLGILPTAEEAREFVGDSHPQKRAYLVDRLLERPEFADAWALKWSDLLRNEEKVLDRKGVQAFHHWIRQSIATNKPLDQFARELVAARGSSYDSPPANYYRANRDPISRAEATAQLFLGVRLGCAKCHNHPFDRWTQADYYDWADLFARVRYKIVENRRRDNNDNHEFVGEQVVWLARNGHVTNPKTGQSARARFLGQPESPGKPDSNSDDPLTALAAWMTGENLFARVQVNRLWFHLFGRGIVDPIDDFRATNPPTIPSLLEALAAEFIGSGYDMRHMLRLMLLSRTYQLSARPTPGNAGDERNFSRAYVRRLTAEQLLDAQSQVLGVPLQFNGYPEGLRAGQIPGVQAVRARNRRAAATDKFLEIFGKPPRLLTCECERSGETSLAQTFNLISGPMINELLEEPDNHLGRWLAAEWTADRMVDELYWTGLSRPPTPEEKQEAQQHLRATPDRRAALEDLAWAVLNAKEFIFRP